MIMKNLFLSLLLLVCSNVFATNYYLDATAGNDASTGTSAAFAWRTLVKLNSFSFVSGDVIYFKRGESFYGSITRSLSNITLDAYGTGDLPIITGATQLTSWVKTGTNKYYAALNADSTMNIASLDGVAMGRARYPNITDANRGYLTYDGYPDGSTNTGYSTTRIRGTVAGDWTGKKVIVRDNEWRMIQGLVTADSVDALTFQLWFGYTGLGITPTLEPTKDNFGYFFIDDTSFLDQNGEYKYQKNLNRFYMYFSDDNPNGHTVIVSTVDTLINLSSSDNVTINNIRFEYGAQYCITGTTNDNVVINNCEFSMCGGVGMGFYRLSNSNITSNKIYDIMSNGIFIRSITSPYNNITIADNTALRCGIIPGMICTGLSSEGVGIHADVNEGLSMLRNFVSETGVDCYRFQGDILEVAYNWGAYGCSVCQDHAIFYSYTDPADSKVYTDRKFHHNFAFNAVGAAAGTAGSTVRASAFYFDGKSSQIVAENNFGYKCPRKIFNLNIRSNVTIRDNTMILSDTSVGHNVSMGIGIQKNYGVAITGFNMKNNIIWGHKSTQSIIYYTGASTTTTQSNINAEIAAIGDIDSNYYNLTGLSVFKFEAPSYSTQSENFTGWKTRTGFDSHTTALTNYNADSVLVLTNWSTSSSVRSLPGVYKDAKNVTYSGSITMEPYTGALLFYQGPYVGGNIRVNRLKKRVRSN
jgi:hypothetical protein